MLALDHVARGKSVLIAARTDQALDVIMQKLEYLLGDVSFVLRGGRHGQFAELKEGLDKLLSRESQKEITKAVKAVASKRDLTAWDVRVGAFRLARAERGVAARIDDEKSWAHASVDGWQGLRRAWIDWKLRGDPISAQLLAGFHEQVEKQHEEVSQFLRAKIQRRIWRAVRLHRAELRAFRKALGARTTTKQKQYLEGVSRKTLFRTFPLWITTIADVHDLIPMELEEFDLAIIDEATQCDMASCVPILQRAQRVVVTGDPKQLRHVSFLSRERQRNISERVAASDDLGEELDYRGRSLLDLVLEHLETDRQLVFLDEHFRSRPELIAFSNEHLYDRKLKVMRVCPGETELGIRFECVGGKRDGRGVNREEAASVCAAVKELIARERKTEKVSSIGVSSPFRDQVEFLERKLVKELSLADIQRHQLRVGTAYSFQGDERDCMFLSLAVDDESHATAFSYLQRADVFNVSITRARNRQVVFYSFDPRKLGAEDLARKYLEQELKPTKTMEIAEGDGMRANLMSALNQAGYQCRTDLKIGGISIDLAVGLNGHWIGLDLIHRGSADGVLSLEELRLLERAGFRVFPLGEREWKGNQDACIEQIRKFFND